MARKETHEERLNRIFGNIKKSASASVAKENSMAKQPVKKKKPAKKRSTMGDILSGKYRERQMNKLSK